MNGVINIITRASYLTQGGFLDAGAGNSTPAPALRFSSPVPPCSRRISTSIANPGRTDLSNEAQILALSAAPALEFDDFEVAERNLDALQARPQVLVAALYSLHGNLYASYVRPGAAPPPVRAPAIGLRMSSEVIEWAQPVERKGEALGVIYLRAR